MTVKIQRTDGVVIEVQGSAEDLSKVLPILIPLQWTTTYGGLYGTFQLQCDHQYPDMWVGDKPNCMKCGK